MKVFKATATGHSGRVAASSLPRPLDRKRDAKRRSAAARKAAVCLSCCVICRNPVDITSTGKVKAHMLDRHNKIKCIQTF